MDQIQTCRDPTIHPSWDAVHRPDPVSPARTTGSWTGHFGTSRSSLGAGPRCRVRDARPHGPAGPLRRGRPVGARAVPGGEGRRISGLAGTGVVLPPVAGPAGFPRRDVRRGPLPRRPHAHPRVGASADGAGAYPEAGRSDGDPRIQPIRPGNAAGPAGPPLRGMAVPNVGDAGRPGVLVGTASRSCSGSPTSTTWRAASESWGCACVPDTPPSSGTSTGSHAA